MAKPDYRNNALEIIRDLREYLLSLKETGIKEIPKQVRDDRKYDSRAVISNEYQENKQQQLQMLRDKIGDCNRCKLCKGRTNIVFGTGNPDARLMFVGEGPGQEEDRQGKPFVGRAGELLTKMISAMGLTRDNVYIANVVKCRPPDNRNPEEDEIAACEPFLSEQIDIIRPDIICALGTFAAQTLLDTKTRISDLRGKIHEKDRHKIIATFHPAYLLRNQNEKRRAWEDLQLVMKELGMENILK